MEHNKHTALVWYGLRVGDEIIAAMHFPSGPLLIDFNVSRETLDRLALSAAVDVVRVAAPVQLTKD